LNKSNWKEYAELIGIAAIVASLVFVGMQIRQDANIAFAERLATEQLADLEIARFIDERREVWRRGLAGDKLSEDDQMSFNVIAYALFRQQANDHRSGYFLRGVASETLLQNYAFFLYQNPGLRTWFDDIVEVRAIKDRAFGLPDDIKFFPREVSERLRDLDDAGTQSVSSYPLPY